MPLKKGSSDAARSANIAIERRAGKPAKQAEAIAYSVQRKARDGVAEHHWKHKPPSQKVGKDGVPE